ncbi:MAG TPA: polysaccharide pyruvyl transferase family protein, partial [Acidimicrobiales bacterium]|nr:polysaccharide pyruvyl transferase family protein [Acidimicrobiales bacterium]
MRILVDHSGYDLLNVGDAAMLQACLARLADRWPDAEAQVVCRSSGRLEELWPPAIPLGPSIADRAPLAGRSQRTRLGLEQVFKMAAPLVSPGWNRRRSGRAGGTILAAVRDADVVVAGGGGYLTDPWWWHGSGVLSVLGLAQRLGRPTAMFGQGIGPLRHPLVRRQARRVLPRLEVLGLREPVLGPAVLGSLGTGPIPATVTGDDALEDACGP